MSFGIGKKGPYVVFSEGYSNNFCTFYSIRIYLVSALRYCFYSLVGLMRRHCEEGSCVELAIVEYTSSNNAMDWTCGFCACLEINVRK